MINCNCRCTGRFDCLGLGITASLIIGIIAGVLRFTAVITVPSVFLWVTFGIALGVLLLLFAKALFGCSSRNNGCICANLTALIVGVLVTLLASVVLLGVTFAATSVLGAIVVGILLAAFSLIFSSIACFVKCTANCNTCDD